MAVRGGSQDQAGGKTMTTQSGKSAEASIDDQDDGAAETSEQRKRRVRVRVRVKRKGDTVPRWLRVTLWFGIPAMAWVAAYLIGLALL